MSKEKKQTLMQQMKQILRKMNDNDLKRVINEAIINFQVKLLAITLQIYKFNLKITNIFVFIVLFYMHLTQSTHNIM